MTFLSVGKVFLNDPMYCTLSTKDWTYVIPKGMIDFLHEDAKFKFEQNRVFFILYTKGFFKKWMDLLLFLHLGVKSIIPCKRIT